MRECEVLLSILLGVLLGHTTQAYWKYPSVVGRYYFKNLIYVCFLAAVGGSLVVTVHMELTLYNTSGMQL